ncbi:MAG: hypothetical protein HC848_03900 [Limnobacter sp.]|nr:hypothetical protein [Limnobacter sp.]
MRIEKAVSHGGLDVIIGAYTPAESWNSLLEQAVQEGGWIVQKWLNSVAVSSIEPMIDSSTEPSKQKNDVIFGMFVVADKAIGGFSRMLPKSGYLPMRQEEQDALKQLSISATANADSEVALCPIFYTRKQPAQAASEAFHREGH